MTAYNDPKWQARDEAALRRWSAETRTTTLVPDPRTVGDPQTGDVWSVRGYRLQPRLAEGKP